jgi:hypothetical protein
MDATQAEMKVRMSDAQTYLDEIVVPTIEDFEPGPPMTLGKLRRNGVRGLAVYCLNHSCQHRAVISAEEFPDELEVPSFGLRMKCSKCGGKRVDVRPNWKEASPITDWRGRPAMPSDD